MLIHSKDLAELPYVSTLVTSAHLQEEGWSWGRGLDLATSLTDWVPGGGSADNVAAVSFGFFVRHSDEAFEGGVTVGRRFLREGVEEGGRQPPILSRDLRK